MPSISLSSGCSVVLAIFSFVSAARVKSPTLGADCLFPLWKLVFGLPRRSNCGNICHSICEMTGRDPAIRLFSTTRDSFCLSSLCLVCQSFCGKMQVASWRVAALCWDPGQDQRFGSWPPVCGYWSAAAQVTRTPNVSTKTCWPTTIGWYGPSATIRIDWPSD